MLISPSMRKSYSWWLTKLWSSSRTKGRKSDDLWTLKLDWKRSLENLLLVTWNLLKAQKEGAHFITTKRKDIMNAAVAEAVWRLRLCLGAHRAGLHSDWIIVATPSGSRWPFQKSPCELIQWLSLHLSPDSGGDTEFRGLWVRRLTASAYVLVVVRCLIFSRCWGNQRLVFIHLSCDFLLVFSFTCNRTEPIFATVCVHIDFLLNYMFLLLQPEHFSLYNPHLSQRRYAQTCLDSNSSNSIYYLCSQLLWVVLRIKWDVFVQSTILIENLWCNMINSGWGLGTRWLKQQQPPPNTFVLMEPTHYLGRQTRTK